MRTLSGLKTNIKHFELCLEEAKYTLQEVEKSIEHEKDEIDRYDSKKDKAFEKIVKHRQRYIELSDDMNREINQHISKKKRCCTCNPCEFFNN
jgi:chromosome segregation ATPase